MMIIIIIINAVRAAQVEQWLAILPHNKNVLSSILPSSQGFFVWSLYHQFSVFVFSPRGAVFNHPGGEISYRPSVGQVDPPAEETGPTLPQTAEELRHYHSVSSGRVTKTT